MKNVVVSNSLKTVYIAFRTLLIRLKYASYQYAGLRECVHELAAVLVESNMLFIKIFQYLSSFTTDFSPEVLSVFRSYTNHATFSRKEDVDETRLNSILSKYGILLEKSDPINSGSIAIVFKGHMVASGSCTPVVIKLKKKNVLKRLSDACSHMQFLFDLVKTFSMFDGILSDRSLVDLLQPFIDNLDSLLTQCDFGSEIANMERICEETKRIRDYISVPKCYNDERDKGKDTDFIILEYIDGASFGDPRYSSFEDNVKREYAKSILIYGLSSISTSTCIHVDLHLGNILLVENSKKVCLIDFGMTEDLDSDRRKPLLEIFKICVKYFRGRSCEEDLDLVTLLLKPLVCNIDETVLDEMCLATRKTVNKDLYDVMVVDCIIRGNINEYNLYKMLHRLNGLLKQKMQFKPYFYNLLLGLGMTNKSIHNLLGFRDELYKDVMKDAIKYVFMDNDDDDDDDDENDAGLQDE